MEEIDRENIRMEHELKRKMMSINEYLKRKEKLEEENAALEQEERIRGDLIKLRSAKVMEVLARRQSELKREVESEEKRLVSLLHHQPEIQKKEKCQKKLTDVSFD